jgi:hypothetical protein
LMEWQAVKEIMANEDIELNFDIPTDLELAELAAAFEYYADGDEEDEEELPF